MMHAIRVNAPVAHALLVPVSVKSFSFSFPAAFASFSLIVSSALGCSADASTEESRIREATEVVSPPDADVALAIVREGDSLYVARAARLDRIDTRTGVVSAIAGPEWATCPRASGRRWENLMINRGYANLAVKGTTLFLREDECGVWSYDVATKQRHMLVDVSTEIRAERAEAEGVFPQAPTWNGKTGPNWHGFGMALAVDNERLVGCFTVRERGASSSRDLVELWAISTDGTPLERIASLETSGQYHYCAGVVPDATSILFATNDAVHRWDRASRTLSTVAAGFDRGPNGLAQDDRDVFLVGDQNEVVKISRADGTRVVLRPASAGLQDSPRTFLTLGGDHVYFHESHSLMRMNKDGSHLLAVAAEAKAEEDWVPPMTIGIGDGHVYFERLTRGYATKTSADGSVDYRSMTSFGSIHRAPR